MTRLVREILSLIAAVAGLVLLGLAVSLSFGATLLAIAGLALVSVAALGASRRAESESENVGENPRSQQ